MGKKNKNKNTPLKTKFNQLSFLDDLKFMKKNKKIEKSR